MINILLGIVINILFFAIFALFRIKALEEEEVEIGFTFGLIQGIMFSILVHAIWNLFLTLN